MNQSVEVIIKEIVVFNSYQNIFSISMETSFASTIVWSYNIPTDGINITAVGISDAFIYD